MQSSKLRWGVIGTARIADALVRAIELSPNGDLLAVASRDINAAQAWANERGVPNAFGTYDAMLASDVIDAVYVPLPNAMHKEWSIKAMQHGKHVLCEKPLASSAADVQEMAAAAESSGVKLMEAFMYRFHPATAHLLQLLAEGAIGAPRIIRATFGFKLDRADDIRWNPDLAGGSLMDVGCYCVNIATLLAGGQPDKVTASAAWASSGVDESLVGTLEYPDGLLATVDCSFSTGVKMQQGLTVSGTEGRIIVPQPFRRADAPVEIIIDRSDGGDYASHIDTIQVPAASQYALMAEHFADAVLNNYSVSYTPQDSLGNMHVIDALKESVHSGKTVNVGRYS